MTAREIEFSSLCGFFDKQWEATQVADTHRYTLYGGSRGPGKSHWLRWYTVRALLRWAAQGQRGVHVGLFSEDYPSLKDRQITKIAAQFPAWLGELKDSKVEGLAFHLREAYGGGVIALRNLDDPAKYQSAEYALIAVEELTKNVESTFHMLRGSLRWPGIENTRFVAASNPNGKGQAWARAYFVERQLPVEMRGRESDFAYVPALPRDNPYLPQSYWDELNSLPEALRRAWRDGDWYVIFEGLVYPEFGAENLTDDEPDLEQTIELAVDDGYVDPRAILFVQRTGTRILIFDEIYHSRHLGETCVSEVIQRCGERWGWADEETKTRPARMPEIAVGSPEAKDLQERFRRADIPYRAETHKIVEGIKVLRRLICDGQGYRALQVHRRCRNLIRELTEGYQYPAEGTKSDDENPLDGNDHACDALRYWTWLRARR